MNRYIANMEKTYLDFVKIRICKKTNTWTNGLKLIVDAS